MKHPVKKKPAKKTNLDRTLSVLTLSASVLTCTVQLGGCASYAPEEVSGRHRVPANDPERVQALQQQVAQDRTLLTENNLLKAKVDVLQQKLIEMTSIVREALVLPPAPTAPPVRPYVAPTPPTPPIGKQSYVLPSTPPYAYRITSMGVVIRTFHPFAGTDFQPDEATAKALREVAAKAEKIEVRGYTDSRVINPIDRDIAMQRAWKARTWLVDNGAKESTIRTRYFSAGHFIADNSTTEGRARNRRVEIDINNSKLSFSQAPQVSQSN